MISKKIVLHFPQKLADQPIVCKLARDYNLEFSILKASITPEEGGLLVLGLSGEVEGCRQGIRYLTEMGVKTQPLSQDIVRNYKRCSHCGVCIPLCPAEAFEPDLLTREISFNDTKCIACGLCVKICPLQAMEVSF